MADGGKTKVWFPAKRYGWGWGFPRTWQGLVVMAAWVLLTAASGWLFLPRHPFLFNGALLLLMGFLMAVCWIKGEKPRWRWGKD